LRVTGLEVRYGGLVALRDIEFTVPPGGMLAVTGPSGAGKSSLLWALAGATAHVGQILMDGRAVADRTEAAQQGITLTTASRRSSPRTRTFWSPCSAPACR
jgi:putative ABC transport system ATP-binding protein